MLDGGRVGNYVDQRLCTLASGIRCVHQAECNCPRTLLFLFGNGIGDENEQEAGQ